jgi:hypothetical protein
VAIDVADPAQPEDAEQPTRDRCRLGNDLYPDIVDDVLDIGTLSLSAGELNSQDEIWHVVSRDRDPVE